MSVAAKTGRQAFGGERHLMWCGANGERELHCYSASEIEDLFTPLEAYLLLTNGNAHLRERGRMNGQWIDLVFAGEALLLRLAAEGEAA